MNMLGAKEWPTPPQGEDHAMLSEELEVEETQIDQSFLDSNTPEYNGYRSIVWRKIGAETSMKHACQLTAQSRH